MSQEHTELLGRGDPDLRAESLSEIVVHRMVPAVDGHDLEGEQIGWKPGCASAGMEEGLSDPEQRAARVVHVLAAVGDLGPNECVEFSKIYLNGLDRLVRRERLPDVFEPPVAVVARKDAG